MNIFLLLDLSIVGRSCTDLSPGGAELWKFETCNQRVWHIHGKMHAVPTFVIFVHWISPQPRHIIADCFSTSIRNYEVAPIVKRRRRF